MCVTLGEADLSQTTLYVGVSKAFTADHRDIHVCGYQNKVQNGLVGVFNRWYPNHKNSGNAMILPFPAIPGTMSQKNFLTGMDVCSHVLQDMAEAVNPPMRSRGDYLTLGVKSPDVEIFELDIYTVILAQNARLIPDVIAEIRKEKRPPLKPSTFSAYDVWYPDWPIAVCCFNNEEAALANPIMPWYEPLRPEFLFAPTLDCHTGGVPNLDAHVRVDHTLIVGADRAPKGKGVKVTYQDSIPAHVQPHLPERVMGRNYWALMPNGDFAFRTSQVEEGIFNPVRLLPPGASRA